MNKVVNVGVIGYGVVGKGTVAALIDNFQSVKRKTGIDIIVKGVADISIDKKHDEYLLKIEILTKDAMELITNKDIHIIVELVGGYTFAKDFVIKALENKKHVVTANKALLAIYGKEIFPLAKKMGVDIGYEASVGGGIPIIRVMKEDLAVNNILEIYSIINGTANYILTKMTEEGKEFADVLKDAQKQGYAEADPTFDIEGIDSAHKLSILSSIAFSTLVDMDKVFVEGISNIKPIDIAIAKEFGCVIKLLAIAKRHGNDIEVRVHPTMIPVTNTLAQVNGVFNAVYLKSDKTGPTLHYGQGAGSTPTGAAVAGDIINIARNITSNIDVRVPVLGYVEQEENINVINIKDIHSSFYMRLMVEDTPGVLAQVGLILANNGISVSSALQRESSIECNGCVPLVFMTHDVIGSQIINAVKEIDSQPFIKEKTVIIRVEGN